jgi:hypothetical protein
VSSEEDAQEYTTINTNNCLWCGFPRQADDDIYIVSLSLEAMVSMNDRFWGLFHQKLVGRLYIVYILTSGVTAELRWKRFLLTSV